MTLYIESCVYISRTKSKQIVNFWTQLIFNVNIIRFICNRKKVDKKTNNYRQMLHRKLKIEQYELTKN